MMHEHYHSYWAPLSGTQCTITRRLLVVSEHNQSIQPINERQGHESTRAQYLYTARVDGREAGTLRLIELEPGLAFIGWVGVERRYRRRGMAEELHRRVLADFGALAVEDFASAAELGMLATLERRGVIRIEERAGVEALRITRHCRVVERMYVVRPGLGGTSPRCCDPMFTPGDRLS